MILRRGATPAVLRLYDETESERNFELGDTNVLIVLDEADLDILLGTFTIVDAECSPEAGAQPLDDALVDRWLGHRNDVSALAPLWRGGIVVDTAEISGPWSALPGLFDDVIGALNGSTGRWRHRRTNPTPIPTARASTSPSAGAVPRATPNGGSATTARRGTPSPTRPWRTVRRSAITTASGSTAPASCPGRSARASRCLRGLKATFDPNGILNPGKFGLASPFGPAPWA